MRKRTLFGGALALGSAALLYGLAARAPAQNIAQPPGDDASANPGDDQGYQALTRGPMHEAFAMPYTENPQPGIIVEQQPPDPIDEIPPDEMPEGDNVVWIPGYWGWDPDSEQFLWISGLWRNVPDDLRWVPGYWTQMPDGYQWVSGFWTKSGVEELAYLPAPPTSLEQGPNIEPPDGDYFWVPGCWIWQTADYQWRPGYWAPVVADWIWIPDQYVWTPYGCVFVPGHWDFDVIERGVMFAPVAFQQPIYRQPNYQYVPTVVINPAPLLLHLFVSPGYSHYFYGDYYGYQPNNNFGFYPWYAYGQRRSFYDPLLTYYQWSYAQRNVNLIQRLTLWNGYFAQNQAYRPPRTFAAQRRFLGGFNASSSSLQAAAFTFASPLQSYARSRSQPFAFTQVSAPQRQHFIKHAQSLRQFQHQRNQFEVAEAGGGAARAPRNDSERQNSEAEHRSRSRQSPAERKLRLPEATAVAQAERAEAGPEPNAPGATRPTGDAGERRNARDGDNARDGGNARERGNNRRPPAPPTPTGSDRGNAERPDRGERGPRPGSAPNAGRKPSTETTNPPGSPQNAGNAPDRPGEAPDAAANTPNRRGNAPDLRGNAQNPNLPGAADTARPDRGRRGGAEGTPNDDQGPAFPRFGVGRNRNASPASPAAGNAPGAETPPTRPERGANAAERGRGVGNAPGRGGFDPFGGAPPGSEEAAGLRGRGRDRNSPGPGTQPVPPGQAEEGQPSTPGAVLRPDRRRPNLPEGAPTLPGGRGNLDRPGRGRSPELPGAVPGPTPSARPPATRPPATRPPAAAVPPAGKPPAAGPPAGGRSAGGRPALGRPAVSPPAATPRPERNPQAGGPKPNPGGPSGGKANDREKNDKEKKEKNDKKPK